MYKMGNHKNAILEKITFKDNTHLKDQFYKKTNNLQKYMKTL